MQHDFPGHTPLTLSESLRPYIGWMIKETEHLRLRLASPLLSAPEKAALRRSLENLRSQIVEFEEFSLSLKKKAEKHSGQVSVSPASDCTAWAQVKNLRLRDKLKKFFSLP